MSTILIFREPRTGGTWFSDHVATFFGFDECFLDGTRVGLPPADSDLEFNVDDFFNVIKNRSLESTVFSTHFFTALKVIDRLDNPILIRCARRNTVEQFLSYWLIKTTGYRFTNFTRDENYEKHKESFEKAIQQQLIVPKKDVTQYMRIKQRNEMLWEEYATKYQNFTVYYEDLCETGVDIPFINLYNCKITNEGLTEKLPEYKSKVFLNYDMIQKWIEDYQ